MRVGIIGLGVMGYRIGANLAKEGKLNGVYNRTQERSEKFQREFGVKGYSSVDEAVKDNELIITMLSDDNAVKSVIEQIIPNSANKVIVDMSTISPRLSISLSKEI